MRPTVLDFSIMIRRFRVQNYKALRDVTVDLTPMHVLIGPNDSGKTSIIEALAALCRSVDHRLTDAFLGRWEGRRLARHGDSDGRISLSIEAALGDQKLSYLLVCRFHPTSREATIDDERLVDSKSFDWRQTGHNYSRVCRIIVHGEQMSDDHKQAAKMVHDVLAGAQVYRWAPNLLALPVAPDAKRRFRMETSGFGLALLLDDILGYDRKRFTDLEDRFRAVFPQVRSIKLIPEMAYRAPVDDPEQTPLLERRDGKGLYFEFVESHQDISAAQVSDGVLLVLAYLAVMYVPQPPRVLLVEEPENGIHPKRLGDVLGILRQIVQEQKYTQVLMTTHSPYVLDQFKPEEVTLCRKENDGSVSVHRLSESKAVREQLDVFTLGEIWTAEGDEALAGGTTQQQEAIP